MEDSLYGFRFKSQTSLLVANQHEMDEVEMESTQWQESRQDEARTLQSPHNYCDEATQTPNWECQDQCVDTPSTSASQTYTVEGGRGQTTGWIGQDDVYVQMANKVEEFKRQVNWHQARLAGYCPSLPPPQRIGTNQVSDASMQMFSKTDPFEAGGEVSCDDTRDSMTDPQIEHEGGSDASSVTMEDVRADDEGAGIGIALHPDDLINPEDMIDLEDEMFSDDSDEDVVGEGSTLEQLRQLLYEANGEVEDMCE